jgi:plastocyanin
MRRAFLALLAISAAPWAAAQNTETVTVPSGPDVFTPNLVTIEVGDTVHWIGLNGGGGAPHNVVEVGEAAWNANQNSPNGGFNSGPDSFSTNEFMHTFNSAGTFYYICQPHISSSMKGRVIVNMAPPIPVSTPWGLIAMVGMILIGAFFIERGRIAG